VSGPAIKCYLSANNDYSPLKLQNCCAIYPMINKMAKLTESIRYTKEVQQFAAQPSTSLLKYYLQQKFNVY